jgi:hypothetical protein
MRSKALLIIAAMVLTSCVSEDTAPVKAEVDYQLLCDGSTGCYGLMSLDKHAIKKGVDGQEDLSMSCSIGEKVSDLSFALSGSDFSIALDSFASGKNKGCTINVKQGSNNYAKNCVVTEGGKADCSEEASAKASTASGVSIVEIPCQVSVKRDGSTITGTVCCRSIPMASHVAQENELSLLSSEDPSEPASFEFTYCR